MRIVVTNDDGVASPGLAALARAVATTEHDLVVVAPADDMSGTSSSIGRWHADGHIDTERVALDGVDAECHAVDGPPALCVIAAHLGAFGEPPALVVSGINPGPNTGGATLHSGTVGAALTGANFGISGLAVSLAAGEPYHWETAATLAVSALDWLVEQPARTVLNLNVPNVPLDEVRGVRWGQLARFGSVRTTLVESQGGRLQMGFAESEREIPPESDAGLLARGYAAVTTLLGIQAGPEPADLPAFVVRPLPRTA